MSRAVPSNSGNRPLPVLSISNGISHATDRPCFPNLNSEKERQSEESSKNDKAEQAPARFALTPNSPRATATNACAAYSEDELWVVADYDLEVCTLPWRHCARRSSWHTTNCVA